MVGRRKEMTTYPEEFMVTDKDWERLLQAGKWVVLTLGVWFATLPEMVHALAIMQVLDTVGGLLVAGTTEGEKISSKAFGNGWRRKAYAWVLVMALYGMQKFFMTDFPIVVGKFTPAELLAGAFVFMELISIVEKAIKLGVPVPEWLILAMTDGRRRFTGEA